MSGIYSKSDVSSHSKPDSLWIVVDEDVYDLTKFQEEHPGGKKSRTPMQMSHTSHMLIFSKQYFNVLQEKMLASSSGSITMRAS